MPSRNQRWKIESWLSPRSCWWQYMCRAYICESGVLSRTPVRFRACAFVCGRLRLPREQHNRLKRMRVVRQAPVESTFHMKRTGDVTPDQQINGEETDARSAAPNPPSRAADAQAEVHFGAPPEPSPLRRQRPDAQVIARVRQPFGHAGAETPSAREPGYSTGVNRRHGQPFARIEHIPTATLQFDAAI